MYALAFFSLAGSKGATSWRRGVCAESLGGHRFDSTRGVLPGAKVLKAEAVAEGGAAVRKAEPAAAVVVATVSTVKAAAAAAAAAVAAVAAVAAKMPKDTAARAEEWKAE